MADVARNSPELAPALIAPDELSRVEPAVAPGLWGCRLDTGYPVRPAAATRAFAKRGLRRRRAFPRGETAWPWVISGRTRGVLAAGVRRPAGAVLVAAGPWTPEVIDPTRTWRPIVPVWGAVAEVEMDEPPRHVLEEAGWRPSAAAARRRSSAWSRRTAGLGGLHLPAGGAGRSRVGADAAARGRALRARPAAREGGRRARARRSPSTGGHLVGEVPDNEGLWTAAGHGPWGIPPGRPPRG